jgi:hypothetical protein
MRLIQLPIRNYDPLIHDLIKNTVILLTIEFLQGIFIGDPLFDGVFLTILVFTIIGNLIFYLVVDRYIVGSGPIMSGNDKID